MRYYFIAAMLHALFFFNFSKAVTTMGNPEHLNRSTIPISYNVKNLPPRIDNTKKVKGSQAKKAAPPAEKTIKEDVKKKKVKTKPKAKTEKKVEKIEPPRPMAEKRLFKSTIKEIESRVEQQQKKVKSVNNSMKLPEKEVEPISKLEEVKEEKEKNKKVVEKETFDEKQEKPEEKLKKAEKTNIKQAPKVKKFAKDGDAGAFAKNGNFTANADGSYTAHSAKGLDFKISYQVDPDYPRLAEVIRYSKTVVVEARFLVDLEGDISKIKITKSHEKFGFDKEVRKALRKWKFKPITHNGKKLKVYFNKKFVFKSKS